MVAVVVEALSVRNPESLLQFVRYAEPLFRLTVVELFNAVVVFVVVCGGGVLSFLAGDGAWK